MVSQVFQFVFTIAFVKYTKLILWLFTFFIHGWDLVHFRNSREKQCGSSVTSGPLSNLTLTGSIINWIILLNLFSNLKLFLLWPMFYSHVLSSVRKVIFSMGSFPLDDPILFTESSFFLKFLRWVAFAEQLCCLEQFGAQHCLQRLSVFKFCSWGFRSFRCSIVLGSFVPFSIDLSSWTCFTLLLFFSCFIRSKCRTCIRVLGRLPSWLQAYFSDRFIRFCESPLIW